MVFDANKLNFQASVEFSKLKDWCDVNTYSESGDTVPICMKPDEVIGQGSSAVAVGIPAYGKSCQQTEFEHRCFVPREFAENSLILNSRPDQTKDETYFVKYLSPAERLAMSALMVSPAFQIVKDMIAKNIGADAKYLDNVDAERLVGDVAPLLFLAYGPESGPDPVACAVGVVMAIIIIGYALGVKCN